MESTVKVSVITPVYNMMAYLEQSVKALSGQTLEEIELICVDDGSTDDSLECLRTYQSKDPRIKVIQNTEEGPGAGCARNTGLALATGEFVLVVDSDDDFHPTLLEKAYHKAIETGADVVLFDADKFDSDTGEKIPCNQFLNPDLLPETQVFSPKEVANHLFLLADGVAWNKLIRRSLITTHQLEFFPVHVVDDMNFTFSVMVLAEKIAVVPEKLLFYRVNNGSSQMANVDRDPLTPKKVLTRLLSFLQEKKLFETYQETYVRRSIALCMFYFDHMKQPENFALLYHYLHQEGLDALALTTEVPLNHSMGTWLHEVRSLNGWDYIQKQEEKEQEVVFPQSRCLIYGFGVRIQGVFDKIIEHGGICVGIADSSSAKQGQVFRGLEVQGAESFHPHEIDRVLISTPSYYDEIKENLQTLGFSQEQITLI